MAHPFAAFYHGKRVLVTGHTGFHGGWLVAWLKLLGAKVLGYGLPPATRPNFFDATLLDRGISSIFGDVRDRNALADAFAEFQPEIVIHLGWKSAPSPSHGDPVENFAVNTMGTVHLLEEVRQTGSVRGVVLVVNESCYEDRDWFWGYREEDALGGTDSYLASLAAAETAASGYARSFFSSTKTAVASARMVGSIGGGDWAEHRLVPELVHAISSEQPIVVRDPDGSGQHQHVLESARACLLLGQNLYEHGQKFAGPWNFAPPEDQVVSRHELAKDIIARWGTKIELATHQESGRRKHPMRLNSKKAQSQLGWQTALNLDHAVQWTVEWYRAFYANPASAWQTTEAQLARYTKSAI
jgi:CDP-glucose 4,6-dehydratase